MPRTRDFQPFESSQFKIAPELINQADVHLKNGDLASAYSCLARVTEIVPGSVQARMMAGLVAVKLKDFTGARDQFVAAVRTDPSNSDAHHNLALVYLAQDHFLEALAQFRTMLRAGIRSAAVMNDLAVVYAHLKRKGRALACYRQAMVADPNNSRIRNNAMQYCLENGFLSQGVKMLDQPTDASRTSSTAQAESRRWRQIFAGARQETITRFVTSGAPQLRGTKIAFFASYQTFLTGIIDSLEGANQVKVFDSNTPGSIADLMGWADIAWFEWCDQLLIEATKLPKRCPIVCRIHSYEVFTDMPRQVDWSKVDQIIFVNDSVRELFDRQVKTPTPKTVIHNGLDLSRFSIPENKGRTKRIASVGYINYKKNPGLLLYCFKKIHEYDPAYTLHIAGEHQDPRILLYMQNYLKRHPLPIVFEGWIKDMPTWYCDKDFVISTSLFESFHYSIAEGMASGVLPLIHDWYGAEKLYPAQFLYSDPDDCLRLVKSLESSDWGNLRQSNRRFIEERYNQTEKLSAIESLLCGLRQQSQGPD